MPARDRKLAQLRKLARSKLDRRPGLLILPNHALRLRAGAALDYVARYYRGKVVAPFVSPFATEFEFRIETPFEVTADGPSGVDLVAALENEFTNVSLYLSNYLTHPRYAGEEQVGFARGDTLRPVGLTRVAPRTYRFGVKGLIVGRRDMLKSFRGANREGPLLPEMADPPAGWSRLSFCMPTRPDAHEVEREEWYEFSPKRWLRKHPRIPLRPPLPVRLRARAGTPPLAPQYDRLYGDGNVRIALLFGYDEETHNAAASAKEAWQVLTAPPSRRFTLRDTGKYGYHGPGLGFSDPTGGDFDRLNLDGTDVFQRNAAAGMGAVAVRYRLLTERLAVGGPTAPEGSVFVGERKVRAGQTLEPPTVVTRTVNAQVRVFNFDKAAPGATSGELIERFVSVFRNNDVIHYDGHANYGGGFYIGEQPDDILWADEIGDYADDFSRAYQIFSIGACHSAGYFADLFYNELKPRKSPRNLDVIAAVNENAFEDAVHVSLELIRALLQHKIPVSEDPPDYLSILTQLSRPSSFHAYTGVFGRPAPA